MLKQNTILFILFIAAVLLSSCGEKPSAPPDVGFGALDVWAYYDSTWVDTSGNPQITQVLAPYAVVTLDDSALVDSGAVPLTVSGIVPGQHFVHIRWNDAQNSLMTDIAPGETVDISSTLSAFAPDFSAPALHYDTLNQQIVHLDSISLSDYAGQVVLLFFYGST